MYVVDNSKTPKTLEVYTTDTLVSLSAAVFPGNVTEDSYSISWGAYGSNVNQIDVAIPNDPANILITVTVSVKNTMTVYTETVLISVKSPD